MKKLMLFLPLIIGGMMTLAMDKSELRSNPFLQFPHEKAPQLSEEKILQIIIRGDYQGLAHELANHLNANYRFTSGEHKGKSLLQVAFGNSISNRHDMANQLLRNGANPEDLNDFFRVAVKKFNPDDIQWLIVHGAKPDNDVYPVVASLERVAQGDKKEKLTKIKELLQGRHTLVTPMRPAASLPIALEGLYAPPPVAINHTKPVKKEDLFTVLGDAEEQKLFNAVLAGDKEKLAEYLKQGVSPNFVFWKRAPGQSLLAVVVTQSLKNYKELGQLLLDEDASIGDLRKGLIPAIEKYDVEKITWLMNKGAKPTQEDSARIAALEKMQAPAIKQQKLAEIKKLLEGKQSLVTPVARRGSSPIVIPSPAPRVVPAKPLPPIPAAAKNVNK